MTYRDQRDEQIERLRAELAEARAKLHDAAITQEALAADAPAQFSPLRPLVVAPAAVMRWCAWHLVCDMAITYPSRTNVRAEDGLPLFISSMFLVGLPLLALRWYLRSALHFDDDSRYRRFVKWCGRAA